MAHGIAGGHVVWGVVLGVGCFIGGIAEAGDVTRGGAVEPSGQAPLHPCRGDEASVGLTLVHFRRHRSVAGLSIPKRTEDLAVKSESEIALGEGG